MFSLYDYQAEAEKNILIEFKKGNKRVLFQLPTGGGKTVIFSFIANAVAKKYKNVCIISHRIELLNQAGGTLSEFGIHAELVTAKSKEAPTQRIVVAMTGTLKNRLNLIKWRKWWDSLDLIIIDEAHRSEFSWIETKGYKLGVSATPLRSGNMPQLKNEYDVLIQGPTVKQLITKGFLLPDNYIGVPVSLLGVKKDSTGDFNNEQLYNKFKSYCGIVENWIKHANGLCTIVFCINIQHCIDTAIQLNEAGIGAKFITSGLSRPTLPENPKPADITRYNKKLREYERYKENYALYSGVREDVIAEWKAEKFPILINAGIAIEGFDHKPIKCVVINLATTSQNKLKQMAGRGSRIFKGKNEFILMDFGGNAERLGHYQQNCQYSLIHNEKISTGNTPYKNCPKCQSLIFISSLICNFCGYEYPEKKEREFVELVTDKAVKLEVKTLSFRELELFAQAKGYKSNWIWRTVYATSGETGLKEFARYKNYSHEWVKIQLKIFAK